MGTQTAIAIPGQHLRRLLGTAVLALTLAAGFNFAVDPLQIYRAAAYAPHFSLNQRYQSPGLARHYAAPILVLGTSHTENWLPADVEKALGQPSLKLSIAGSSLPEQRNAFELAVRSGVPTRVLWAVDHGSTTWLDEVVEESGAYPHHLYGPAWMAAPRYLLSMDTMRDSWRALTRAPEHDLDSLNAWHAHHEFGAARVAAAWDFMGERWTPALRVRWAQHVPAWEGVLSTVQRNLLEPIDAHPQLRFDLVFVPYSIWEYLNDFRVDPERFFQRVLLKQTIAEWSQGRPQLRVWDFETRSDWILDPSRYKDLAHFNLATSRAMLDEIGRAEQPWPVSEPRELVELVLAEMAVRCQGSPEVQQQWCPAEVACGRQRLQHWLQQGAATEDLLRAAWRACD